MQIANFVPFQLPYCLAVGSAIRQRAALWQPGYSNGAMNGHSIRTV